MKYFLPLIVVAILIGLVVAANSVFVVNEYEQALVFQFGEIVRVETEPGLNYKKPFIQNVSAYEKRVLEYDSEPREVVTVDKKTLILDNFAKWRIVDLKLFYNTVSDYARAQARLDDIIYSELLAAVGRATITEVIRTRQADPEMTTNRAEIMERVTRTCNEKAGQYGIEVLDVRIKRADLLRENEAFVFSRMKAERQRIADRFKAEGAEESFQIRAEADKTKTILEAEAYRKAQEVRGEGDAIAARIYAEAFQKDPDFYGFIRTLESYEKTLGARNTTLVLTTESEFFRLLSESK